MIIFRVHYKLVRTGIFEHDIEKLTVDVKDRSIGEIRNGFWINKSFEFSTGSDCKFFIPASQILGITKINVKNI